MQPNELTSFSVYHDTLSRLAQIASSLKGEEKYTKNDGANEIMGLIKDLQQQQKPPEPFHEQQRHSRERAAEVRMDNVRASCDLAEIYRDILEVFVMWDDNGYSTANVLNALKDIALKLQDWIGTTVLES